MISSNNTPRTGCSPSSKAARLSYMNRYSNDITMRVQSREAIHVADFQHPRSIRARARDSFVFSFFRVFVIGLEGFSLRSSLT
jgi:hypothetical protein